jgi:Rrf2 family transcriptional regulator, nitric oxide-sensitive transcriptional repressor
MISQSAEYALRAVVFLAASPGSPQTTQQISSAASVTPAYLAKIMHALTRSGIVSSQRGLHGGFVLAREPSDLTALEVIRIVDPSRRVTECPLGLSSHGPGLCKLHRKLDYAISLVEQALQETRIVDLMDATTLGGRGAPNGALAAAK